jgi:glucosamine--fructose-6-phosphate aminotransferase (isomerizing)
MCGIVAATGSETVLPVLLDGLARLEYRGYDSAGVALDAGNRIWRRRRSGRLATLAAATGDAPEAVTGVGHTRWATHGAPTQSNSHPHIDCSGRLAVVHNGIVENHRELRARLELHGHRFTSETDSEVLAHEIEDGLAAGLSLAEALRWTLAKVEGACGVAVISADFPGIVVAGRQGSPLVVGRTPSAAFVASDVPALLPHTSELYAVEEGQIIEARAGRLDVAWPAGGTLRPERRGLGWSQSAAEQGDYPDFMLKEIHEQPDAIAATLQTRRRDDPADGFGRVPDIDLASIRRVLIVGCGTSLHAGMAARPAFEEWARVPVECEVASELRYRPLLVEPTTLVIGISQSGETADTLGALRRLRQAEAPVLAVTNVVGSAMAREASAVRYTSAGPEIGVAATKTHVAQIVALQELALAIAAARGTLPEATVARLADGLRNLPSQVEKVLAQAEDVFDVARRYADRRDFFFLGRGAGHAVAMEAALKLKEIAYVRAEGYAAGELKHGPIALIEEGTVVVAVLGTGELRAKMLSNVAEMRARGATIVAVATDGDEAAFEVADDVLRVPRPDEGAELLSPAVDAVPLQLFAYAVAKARGLDVDKPRNLAKTVTVE